MSGCSRKQSTSNIDSNKTETSFFTFETNEREEVEFNPAMKAAMVDLKKEKFVKALNSTRDTFFRNPNNKKITYISFAFWEDCPFNNTELHKYLLSHLPKKYIGDTSINTKNTNLSIGMIYYIDYERPWWRFNYRLWYKDEIIMSQEDDLRNSIDSDERMISSLPDMSKYGY